MALWPTMNPALTARLPSRRSSHSPKVSTSPRHARLERRERHALHPGEHLHEVLAVLRLSGAIVKPQLPPITVVMPCSGDGLSVVSQNAWAS